jgi:flagellar protein FliO/FliZ
MTLVEIARISFALLFVLGLIALAAALARKSGLVDVARRSRRLAIVETLAIDPRRRAAILRCDGRDHLVILSQEGVAVIESGIKAPAEAEPIEAPESSGLPESSRLTGRRSAKIVTLDRLFRRDLIDEAERLRVAGAL